MLDLRPLPRPALGPLDRLPGKRSLGRLSGKLLSFGRLVLVATLCLGLGLVAPARAALVSTQTTLQSAGAAEPARERVQAFLARPDVRRQMQELGVPGDEARARVAALADAEVVELDRQLAALPAGEGFLGFALGVIVVTFAVLLITDILGLTDVFTFINPVQGSRSY